METGQSKVFTPHLKYFISGSLNKLDKTMAMDGVSGLLIATNKGQVQYRVINDAGGLSILECEGYLLLDIKMRLVIPHVFIQELQERDGTYTLTWYRSVIILKNGDRISFGYHLRTALPALRDFSDAMKNAKLMIKKWKPFIT